MQQDRKTSLGRRNYAILLLLARLGLRAGEVVRLNLEDLDWEQGIVRVCRKAGRWTVLQHSYILHSAKR
jgi:integrase